MFYLMEDRFVGNCNNALTKAKTAKNDEFYTRYKDIEDEMEYFLKTVSLKDKVVYCNCDDYRWSNFWKYFVDNFERLGLKKLIATCVVTEFGEFAKKVEYDGNSVTVEELPMCFGQFDSADCEIITYEVDWVITNPPFSLFQSYIRFLKSCNVNFLVIGGMSAVGADYIYKLIEDEELFVYPHIHHKSTHMFFDTPGSGVKRVGCFWYSNVSYKAKPIIEYTEVYDESKYVHIFEDAINIDNISEIPRDYDGTMYVPITLLRYDVSMFELLGLNKHIFIDGKQKFTRLAIRWKED